MTDESEKDFGKTTGRNSALRGIPIKVCGVYRIVNTTDGKFYIGSAIDIRMRMRFHLYDLRKNKHHTPHLQRAYLRDGETAFRFEVVELCSLDVVREREQHYLDTLRPFDDSIGYNISPRADCGPIVSWTPEMRAATSARFRGVTKSADHRRKIGEAQKWRRHTPEMRMHLSNKVTEFYSDPRNRDAVSEQRKGKTHRGVPHSLETRRKMSEDRRGRKPHDNQKHTIIHGYEWSRMREMGLTLREISYFNNGVHPGQISKLIRRYEKARAEAA